MPTIPMYEGNRVGTAPKRPDYERPLDVSQTAREASRAFDISAQSAGLVNDRVAQDDALRAQAAITTEFAKFNAKERLASQGRNADGYAQRVDDWWGKAREEYAGALDPRAQRLVGEQLLRARTASLADAAVYQEMQLNVSHVEAYGLARDALTGQVIARSNDAAVIAGAGGAAQEARIGLAEIKKNAEEFAKTQGKGKEWVDAQLLAASTTVHTEVISQMQENDPTKAALYYRAHKEEIDQRLHDTLEKGVRAASAANDSTKAVDQAWAKLGPKNYNDPVAIDKMASAIRELFKDDPTRRNLALSEMKQRVAEHNAAQTEFTAGNTAGALGVYQTTRSLAKVQASTEYQALSATEQLKISTYITQQQHSAIARQEASLNRDIAAMRRQEFLDERAHAPFYNAASDPELLAGINSRNQILALQTTLGPKYTGLLLSKWESIKKSETNLREAKVDYTSMQDVLREMKLDPKTKNKDQQAVIGAVQSRMERAVADAQVQAKKVLTREEKEDVMRREAARTVTVNEPGWIWDSETEVPVPALTAEQLKNVVIPPAQAKELTGQLKSLYDASGGDPQYAPTPENLRRLHLILSGSKTAPYLPTTQPQGAAQGTDW